ncbi:MAG: UDP-glucose/GDP-mannose dehydrogenase family protein [Phycisphaerae bacterium]|jgi:UDPglucose 6-dehydrogenase
MNVAVMGTGYVGLVVGVCFSDTGQFVTCVDKDPKIVDSLQKAVPTIYEPGLQELLERNVRAKRLSFTTDRVAAIQAARIIFVAVGTPPMADGSADLSAVLEVAHEVARHAQEPKIVVMKSTVPPGTHKLVSDIFAAEAQVGIDYVSNPEFLKEGNAIDDFTKPDRVIIGAENAQAAKTVAHLYSPYMRQTERIIITDPATAELAKYAANTMLAMRISFMNEMARLCDRTGANVETVRRCLGSDRRIGPAFLFPGLGYGGSCFPKDVQAMAHLGEKLGCPVHLAVATHAVNQSQPQYFEQMVQRRFGSNLKNKRICVWGLAYKARTDDVRMSPALEVVRWLVAQGASVAVHDPQAMPKARAALADGVTYFDDMYGALEESDAVFVLTDWQEFRNPDLEEMKRRMRGLTIFDGRNLYNPADVRAAGFNYFSVGRP